MKTFTFYVSGLITNPPNKFLNVVDISYEDSLRQLSDYINNETSCIEYPIYECLKICDTEENFRCISELNLNEEQTQYLKEAYQKSTCDYSDSKGDGQRNNQGKLDYSLIPLCTLDDEVKVWEFGKSKYAAWNWTKGMKWSIPFASLMRHMSEWQRGEDVDKESGLPHLAHAMCNLRMLTLYSKNYIDGDDRPKEELK